MKNQRPFHFFASSIGRWQVDDDVEKLIRLMKSDRLSFNLWKVPGAKDADYSIRQYAPYVEGRVYLGCYQLLGPKGNEWKTLCVEDV